MTLLDPDFLPACRFKIDGGGGAHELLADHPHRQHVARMGGPFGGQVGLGIQHRQRRGPANACPFSGDGVEPAKRRDQCGTAPVTLH